MKKILLVLLLSIALGGCATLSNVYNGIKERIYPTSKPIITETPATEIVPEKTVAPKTPDVKDDLQKGPTTPKT